MNARLRPRQYNHRTATPTQRPAPAELERFGRTGDFIRAQVVGTLSGFAQHIGRHRRGGRSARVDERSIEAQLQAVVAGAPAVVSPSRCSGVEKLGVLAVQHSSYGVETVEYPRVVGSVVGQLH